MTNPFIVSNAEALAAFSASGSGPANAIAAIDVIEPVEVEDIDFDKTLDVNSAIAVEKDIAADTMGTLFAAAGKNFLPYVEQCSLELIELTKHYYEGIRPQVV